MVCCFLLANACRRCTAHKWLPTLRTLLCSMLGRLRHNLLEEQALGRARMVLAQFAAGAPGRQLVLVPTLALAVALILALTLALVLVPTLALALILALTLALVLVLHPARHEAAMVLKRVRNLLTQHRVCPRRSD